MARILQNLCLRNISKIRRGQVSEFLTIALLHIRRWNTEAKEAIALLWLSMGEIVVTHAGLMRSTSI